MNSTVEEYIVITLSRVRNEIFRKTNALLKKRDLSMTQFEVLETLRHKGEQTIGEIKESVLGTAGNIPVVVSNLEKYGLVEKKQDKKDKRVFHIQLTSKGEELIDELYPEVKALNIELLSGLKEQDKDDLLNLLSRMFVELKNK